MSNVSLNQEREVAVPAVTIARDHAPQHAISPAWQRRQSYLKKLVVAAADAAAPFVDPAFVAVLNSNIGKQGLDWTIKPDANLQRRLP